MATIDRNDTLTERPRFCPECGHPSGDSNFCPGCGHNMGFAADHTLTDPALQSLGGGGRSRARLAAIVACGALGVVAVAVAAVILLSGGTSSKTTSPTSAYQQGLAKAVDPVISANQTLSSGLTAIDGSQPSLNTAKTDAAQALAALGAARGAVGVLNAPSSQSTLSGQVQVALTAENGYLQAVSSTLATPNGPSTGQLQTLATGAQSALVPLNTVNSGAGTSLSGTNNLLSWAQGASGQAQTQKNAAPQHASQQTTTVTQPAASPTNPAASSTTPSGSPQGLTACDQNISINSSTTSCGFANNVFAQYADAVQASGSPLSTDVTATSPATGATYTDSCQYNDSTQIVLCSHGTDLIQFPEWAAAVYNG